jgi:polysaccharide pyruvyl transferase WcaK-like protein
MAYEEKAKAKQNAMRLPAFVEEKRTSLQQHYIPAVTEKTENRIEQKEKPENRREDMTEEQRDYISRRVQEVQRRLSGGAKETE